MEISATYNIPAEQEVLGAILVNNDCMTDVNIKPNDYFVSKHQMIFGAMLHLFNSGQPIDLTTISEHFKGDISSIGGFTYFTDLINSSVRFDKSKVKIIKDKSNMRKFQKLLDDNMKEIQSNKDSFEIMYDSFQNKLFNIVEEDNDELINDEELMVKTIKMIELNANSKDKVLGIDTGIKELDLVLNGFQKQKVYVIAGRPSMGKSALATTLIQHISKKYFTMLYSLEMGAEEVGIRRISENSFVDSARIERGLMDKNEWDSVMKSSSAIGHQKSFTNTKPGIHINDIRRQCTKLKKQNKLDLIMIDHLGIMSLKGMGDSIREQVSNLCIQIKSLSKELDVPIVILSQLSRAPELRADKRPILSDLKESSGVEENADVVMFLYRDEYYNKDTNDKGIIEVNAAKQRGGRVGTIKLAWMPEFQTIGSIYKG